MSAIRIKPVGDWMDGKGMITVHVSKSPKTIEREVEKQSRLETDLTPEPLFNSPNKYQGKKKCVHPEHDGERWIPRGEFSHDPRMSDGLQSYCKKCRNRMARFAYIPRWTRGTEKKRRNSDVDFSRKRA
jgi:hypothetical protein